MTSIRGTELSVFVDESKATDIFVFEGKVDVSGVLEDQNTLEIVVQAGQKVHITAGGMIGQVEDITL